MILKICPYCDSVMTKKHHCDACNSFVWKAQEIEGDYKMQYETPEPNVSQKTYGYDQKTGEKTIHKKKSHQKKTHKKPAVIFWICFFVIIIGSFLTSDTGKDFIREVKYFFSDIFSDSGNDAGNGGVSAYDEETEDEYDLYNFNPENAEQKFADGIWQYETGGSLEEADVLERGEECNSYVHFPIKLDEGVEAVVAFCKEHMKLSEQDIVVESYPSDNYVMHIGKNEKIQLEKRTAIYDNRDDVEVYMNVEADTATENLHQITATVESEEEARAVIGFMVKTVSGTAAEKDFIDRCLIFDDEHDFTFTKGDGFEIYVSHSDSDYYVSVSGIE